MEIIKLNKNYLKQASNLTLECFPWLKPDFIDYPPRIFEATLDKKKYQEISKELDEYDFDYYILIDNKKLIGITGLYTLKEDQKEANWVGWTCIDPKFQKKGIGTKLVNFIIDKTKSEKKFLRVYTNDTIVKFYEKLGFKKVKTQKVNEYYTRVDMELKF